MPRGTPTTPLDARPLRAPVALGLSPRLPPTESQRRLRDAPRHPDRADPRSCGREQGTARAKTNHGGPPASARSSVARRAGSATASIATIPRRRTGTTGRRVGRRAPARQPPDPRRRARAARPRGEGCNPRGAAHVRRPAERCRGDIAVQRRIRVERSMSAERSSRHVDARDASTSSDCRRRSGPPSPSAC